MATSARRSIEEDLARIRAEAQGGAPGGQAGPGGRGIEADLAAIRTGAAAAVTPPAVPPVGTPPPRTVPPLRIPAIAAEATRVTPGRGADANLTLPQRLAQLPFRMMERGPMTAVDMAAAPIAAAVKGAQFVGQSAAETTLPDDTRAHALADPNRIREEDAALAGLQLAIPTLPATGIIGRAVVGAGTGAAYMPEDPAVGAIVGGLAGGAHAGIAGERLSPGLRILVPNRPAPGAPPVREGAPQLPPGPEPIRTPDQTKGGRYSVVDAEVIPEATPGQKLLPRLRTPPPEEPAPTPRAPVAPISEPPAPVPEAPPAGVSIEADLARIRGIPPTQPELAGTAAAAVPKPEIPSLRDARGKMPKNLTKSPIEALTAEYRRLIDTGQADAGFVMGVEDSPEFMEWHEMPGMPEDRRGVDNFERMAPRGLARTRMENREKSLARIEAELTRRGIDHGEAYYMAEQAANPGIVGQRARLTPAQRKAFKTARGPREPVTAYHGTPHKFDKFSIEHVGTGEGAQSFGHGLYFAGKKEIAAHYREKLSRGNYPPTETLARYFTPGRIVNGYGGPDRVIAFHPGETGHDWKGVTVERVRKNAAGEWERAPGEMARTHHTAPEWSEIEKVLGPQKKGSLFEVGLPDDQTMLDWDKPLSEQSQHVKDALTKAGLSLDEMTDGGTFMGNRISFAPRSGKDLYSKLEHQFADSHSPEEAAPLASETLRKAGIPGHRYLDSGSRNLQDYWALTMVKRDTGAPIQTFRYKTEAEAQRAVPMLEKHNPTAKLGSIERVPAPAPTHNYVIYDDSKIEVKGVEERRATVDRAQMDLFRSGKPSKESTDITFGSQAEKDALTIRVQKQAGPMAETVPPIPSSKQRLRAISAKERAWVDIRGQKVTTVESLHRLLTPFRDPKAEAIGTIMLGEDGKVVAHTLETSGALNYVSAGDVPRWVHTMVARAKRAGVKKVVLHHNHPSGDPTPSSDDKAFTVMMANYLAVRGIKLVGHYVIDHTRGTWLMAEGMDPVQEVVLGRAEAPPRGGIIRERSIFMPKESLGTDWTELHGGTVQPETLHHIVRGADAKGSMLVAYLNSQHRLVAVEPHAIEKVDTVEKWVGERLRAHGASTSVVLLPDQRVAGGDPINAARRLAQIRGIEKKIVDVGVVSYDADDAPMVMSLSNENIYSTPLRIGFDRTPMRAKDLRLPQRLFEPGKVYGKRDVTETPEFKKWFGDSKVVDKSGNPLVVYHGTPKGGFEVFEEGPTGGLFFTDSERLANEYTRQRGLWLSQGEASAIYPVFLSIKNPLVIDAMGTRHNNIRVPWQEWKPTVFGNLPKDAVNIQDVLTHMEQEGHDGVILRNLIDTASTESRTKSTVYVAREPGQVKSAIGNSGRFDPENPSIVREESPEYGRKKEFEEARAAGLKSGLTPEQASAYAAAAKDIDFDGSKAVAHAKAEAGGLRTRLRRWADAAADQTRAIDRLSRKAVEKGMPPERSPEYELALSYNSDDTIRRALYEAPEMATTHGILDPITREPIGPTLESVVAPLGRDPEKVRQAFTYVVALRKVGRGLKATAGSEEELNAAIAAVDALGKIPMYQKFAKDLEAHLDGIGRYAVRSGLWTSEQWEALKHSDLFYVPFKRLMTHIEPPPGKTTYGTKRANLGAGIESFEGSRRFLANPVEAVAGYDARIIRRADAYRVGSAVIDAIVQHMGEEGKAILTPLAENSPEVRAFTAAAVRQNLAKSGLTPAEVGMVADLSTPMIDPHNPVIWRHSKTTGAREYFLLHEPDLYKALVATRADSPLGTGALMTALRLARRIMTVTATGINPRFALGLNIARDVPQAIMQNKGMRSSDIAVAAREALKAVFGRSDFADLMARHGLGSASIYAHDVNAEAVARKIAPVTRMQRLRSVAGGIAGKPLEIAERVGAASDLVGRLSAARASQRRALKAGATSRGAAAAGATTGIRATVNFNRRAGLPVLQLLEQSVPFFGAAVRSGVRATEAVGEVPKRVSAAIAILTLAVLAEWAYSRRDKEKRKAMVDRPATERARFLQFGGYRYPLPQEMAVVAAGIRSALAEISGDDPDHAQQLKEAIYNVLPPFVSDLAQGDIIAPWPGWREVQEIARNKTSYGQRPIVPERLQDLPAALRRNESTAPSFDVAAAGARKFSAIFPSLAEASPLEAEHLVRGFLGNMTPLLTMVTDAVITRTGAGAALPPSVPLPASSHPLNPASAFIVREPPSRTSSESWFYAREKEFSQGQKAEGLVRKMEDNADTPSGKARLETTKGLIGAGKWKLTPDQADDVGVIFKETQTKIKEYRDSEAEIRQRVNNGTLKPESARTLLDALTLERQVMLRDVRANLHKLGVPQ